MFSIQYLNLVTINMKIFLHTESMARMPDMAPIEHLDQLNTWFKKMTMSHVPNPLYNLSFPE